MKKRYIIACISFIVIFPIFCIATVYTEEMDAIPTPELATELATTLQQETTLQPFEPLPIPLDVNLQWYIIQKCEAKAIPPELVMALIWRESRYQADVISATGDYGLMQINKINHAELSKKLNISDWLEPYQNIKAGIYILDECIEYTDNYDKALMCYNLGKTGANRLFEQGVYSTPFSRQVIEKMNELEDMRG